MVSFYTKGQIWWYDNGNVHKSDYYIKDANNDLLSARPVLIVQNAKYENWEYSVSVTMLTGSDRRFGVDTNGFENEKDCSKVLPYKIHTVSTKYLTKYMGTLDSLTMKEVDSWIKYHFGFSRKKPDIIDIWDKAVIENEFELEQENFHDDKENIKSMKKAGKFIHKNPSMNYSVSKLYKKLSIEDKLFIITHSIEISVKEFSCSRKTMRLLKNVIASERYNTTDRDGTPVIKFISYKEKEELLNKMGINFESYKISPDEYDIFFSISDADISKRLKLPIEIISAKKMEIVNKGIL